MAAVQERSGTGWCSAPAYRLPWFVSSEQQAFLCQVGQCLGHSPASLAVRSTYALPGTRAYVFVTMAGLKMGCSALGAALVGAVLTFGPRLTLVVISSLVLAGAVSATVMKCREQQVGRRLPRRAETFLEN
jgi:hypothetical protein